MCFWEFRVGFGPFSLYLFQVIFLLVKLVVIFSSFIDVKKIYEVAALVVLLGYFVKGNFYILVDGGVEQLSSQNDIVKILSITK